jgi:serralysin
MVGTKFPNGPAYLEFSGLNLDGRDTAKNGFLCLRSHHLRFTNNYIKHFGAAGIATVNCDYVTSDRNFIYHNGYVHGWTSGISYNGVPFYDDYGGFHNIVSNNIVSGEYDASSHHTDGNGIIFDLSADRKSGIAYANTPAGLIINNVVYQNGGRCIQNYTVTNIWVVNNTCYKNTLDTSIAGGTAGEIVDKASRDNWYVNNVVYSWESKNPAYKVESGSTGIRWYKNMYWVGGLSGFAASGPNEFIQADPLFTDPPRVLPGARNQHADALPPHQLGKGLRLRSGSPARNKGIDPTVLPNVSSHILDDLKKYVYQDVDGAARPRGGRFDLGAYSELNITHSDRP